MEDVETILQIIPCTELEAVYRDSEGECSDPIVCLALVEISNGTETYREVRPMIADEKSIEFAAASNMVRLQSRR